MKRYLFMIVVGFIVIAIVYLLYSVLSLISGFGADPEHRANQKYINTSKPTKPDKNENPNKPTNQVKTYNQTNYSNTPDHESNSIPTSIPNLQNQSEESIDSSQASALTGKKFKSTDKDAYFELVKSLTPDSTVGNSLEQCIEDLGRRMNKNSVGLGQSYFWNLIVTISSNNGIGLLSGAKLDPSTSWPPYFDDEAKSCYINAVTGFEFVTNHNYEYNYIMPFCITPEGWSPD